MAGDVQLQNLPDPEPSADRILIETIYSGVSWGTETAWLSGKMPYKFPAIPGYLSLGRVLHVGAATGRTDITVGQLCRR